MSGCILHLSILHSPVFLLNSCLDLFSAPLPGGGDPLSRSYGVNLPSSLTVNLSSALVCSTRPPVSVWGTGPFRIKFSGFSWEPDYLRCRIATGALRTVPFQHLRRFCLPQIYLRGLTCYSVSTRECHFSVSTSLLKGVTEC